MNSNKLLHPLKIYYIIEKINKNKVLIINRIKNKMEILLI